jgi:hypothetical protein
VLIQNYGLFWKLKRVDWGAPGRGLRSTLPGTYAKALRADPVEFRDQRGVYVLYDDNFRVVYIGQAGRGGARLLPRLRKHCTDHLADRWSRFSWFGILPVVDGVLDVEAAIPVPAIADVLNHIEAILIAAAEPPLNLQRGRFGPAVQQYLQRAPLSDDDAADDAEEDE